MISVLQMWLEDFGSLLITSWTRSLLEKILDLVPMTKTRTTLWRRSSLMLKERILFSSLKSLIARILLRLNQGKISQVLVLTKLILVNQTQLLEIALMAKIRPSSLSMVPVVPRSMPPLLSCPRLIVSTTGRTIKVPRILNKHSSIILGQVNMPLTQLRRRKTN